MQHLSRQIVARWNGKCNGNASEEVELQPTMKLTGRIADEPEQIEVLSGAWMARETYK